MGVAAEEKSSWVLAVKAGGYRRKLCRHVEKLLAGKSQVNLRKASIYSTGM